MFTSSEILQERYQLQQTLGRTAAGRQTWLATDLHSNEQVVVKLLAFSPQMEWQELKLFEREAQVLQNLNHSRIPQYRDYFSIDREAGSGLPWFGLVQDYIPGCSLQQLLEKGQRFSQEKVQKITIKILKILIYLHQLSPPVLHRDIKPSNLILGEDHNIYLVDFGAVKAQSHLTGVTFTVVGTSGYAPLEQFWGRAVAASDLYALGATLIHLLTGTPPAELPQKKSRIQFSDRVSLDSSFVSWIEKMTEIALEKRFQTAQEALEALTSPKSPHSSDTKGSMWRQVSRPCDTQIQLHQSSDYLNIRFPIKANFSIILCIFSVMIILWTSVIIILLWISAWISSLFLVCLVILLWILGPGIMALVLCKNYSSQNSVDLDTKLLTFTKKSLYSNQILKQTQINISEIKGILMMQQNSGIKPMYQIIIHCKNKSYPFDGYFKEEECLWLTQEIQNWLNSQQV